MSFGIMGSHVVDSSVRYFTKTRRYSWQLTRSRVAFGTDVNVGWGTDTPLILAMRNNCCR